MQPEEFANLPLPSEVLVLGQPERVHGHTGLAPFARWGSWLLGLLCIALPAGALTAFYLTAKPDDKANLGTMIASHGLTFVFVVAGCFLLWLGSTVSGLTSIYAFYREHLAFVWNGTWTVFRWDDIREVLDPGLTCFYARVVLQDGRQIPLKNHFFNPSAFYESVKQQVLDHSMRVPTAGRAPLPAASALPFGACPQAAPPVRASDPPMLNPVEISGSIRTKALQQMALGGALVLIALGLYLYHWRWIKSAIAGPVPMTLSELRAVKDPDALPNPWVSITYRNAIETELVMVSTRKGNSTNRSRYLLIPVQDAWLIADVPYNHQGNQLTGYLEVWWSPLSREVVSTIENKYPAQKPSMLPFQFNAEYQYRVQCLAMVVVMFLLFSIGVVPLWRGWGMHQLSNRINNS